MDKSKCMHSRCYHLHALEGPGDEASTTAAACNKKVVRHFLINSMCKRAMEVIVFSIFSVWMLLSIACGQHDDNSSTYYTKGASLN